ncbi:MAG: DNA repair protein RecO [Gaiellales bacterium]
MAGSYKAQAVVLRSIRYAEADRVLHLYTAERGRVNAIAKGVRRTGSRFGGRLEPLTHAALVLHEGRGELHTVSGADIVRSHAAVRDRPAAREVAAIGAEAMLKLHVEPEPQPQVFAGLVRFLGVMESHEVEGDPALDPVGLAFQLKLLMLAGYLPHLTTCAGCGSAGPLVGFSATAGGAVCAECLDSHAGVRMRADSLAAAEALVGRPLGEPRVSPGQARDALRIVEQTYEFHGGFRLRTLHA